MSASPTTTSPIAGLQPETLTAGQLPKFFDVASLVVSWAVVAAVLALLGNASLGLTVVLGTLLFMATSHVLSRVVEGTRKAFDRTASHTVSVAFAIAVIPLVSLLWTTIAKGLARLDADFFSMSLRNVIGDGGGALHAIMGTLIVTGIAALISVPIGIFAAVYLVEYGRGALSRAITFFVDVMTGIPSIVAGLFAYALFSLLVGPGTKNGLSGAVALCVLMVPYVVRNTEEMLKLVPNELREASYALGVTKWRTIARVVIPTAISGIVSGVMLGVARVIGETAPLLVTAGLTTSMNYNPFEGPMTTLPVFVYYQYMNPGVPMEPYQARAWTGALTLILIVMLLNLLGKFIASRFAPKTHA